MDDDNLNEHIASELCPVGVAGGKEIMRTISWWWCHEKCIKCTRNSCWYFTLVKLDVIRVVISLRNVDNGLVKQQLAGVV